MSRSFAQSQKTRAATFYDIVGSGAYAMAAFQCVSYAEGSDLAAAQAAGIQGGYGEIVIPTPVSAGLATQRIAGVTINSAFSGDEVLFAFEGIAEVMVSGAVAETADVYLHAALREARTSLQTPLTNLAEILIPHDPRFALTYQLCLADDTAITPASTGSNALYFPLGVALAIASAKYDVIPVHLNTNAFYA